MPVPYERKNKKTGKTEVTMYETVAERLTKFHDIYKDNITSIITEVIQFKDGIIVMKAVVKIDDKVYVGHAYEKEGSNFATKSSLIEVCETSCIGRALSSAGLLGSEFCSADELVNALTQQASGTTNVAPSPKKTTSTDEASSKQKGFILKLNREKDYIAETDMELKLQKMNKSEASDLIEFLQDWDKTKERLKEKTTSSEEEVDSLFA